MASWQDLKRSLGPITYAWEPWLPRGFLVMNAGCSGDGKSIMALRIAASYLDGRELPDGTRFENELGLVLWVETENAQAINLARAQGWGLPLNKIITPFDDPFQEICLNDPKDRDVIAEKMENADVKFCVIDALRGAYRGDELGDGMFYTAQFLSEVARNTNKPILLNHHLNKKHPNDTSTIVTLDRVRGKSSAVQCCRVVWAVDAPDRQNPKHKRLSMIKNSIGEAATPIGFTISGENATMTFDQAPEETRTPRAIDRYRDALNQILADGPKPVSEVAAQIKAAGLSWDYLQKLKDTLGIVSHKTGLGKDSMWLWELPSR